MVLEILMRLDCLPVLGIFFMLLVILKISFSNGDIILEEVVDEKESQIEAMKEAEQKRREKHSVMSDEREIIRQNIRQKVRALW